MRVLITGAEGQLGYDVAVRCKAVGITPIEIDIKDADITNEREIKQYIRNCEPDAVIHCAAYTAVDKAEDERELCYNINVNGTRYIAQACAEHRIKMIYISTDYTFGGSGEKPWDVDDVQNPINYYGESKYLGELEVKCAVDKYFIVRISWVFGKNGNNFVNTMLRLGKDRNEINVVDDQIGSPTYTKDLAALLCDMLQTEAYGIYHVTNEGYCSWADFAEEIFKAAGYDTKVNRITSEEYPTRAARPKNSRLNKQKITLMGFNLLRSWGSAVREFIGENEEY